MRTIEEVFWIIPQHQALQTHNVILEAWVTFPGVMRNGLLNEVLLMVLRFFSTGYFFPGTPKEKVEADHRSVYVGNVSSR